MQDLLDLVERVLGKGWREVIEHLRDTNSIDDIAEHVHRGDYASAVQGVEDAAKAFADTEHAAYVESGQTAAAWLDGQVDDLIKFDAVNHRAVQWARRNEIELRGSIETEQKALISRVIADGVAEGRNPREVARDVRDSIGLTDYQARIVENYRKALQAGDSSALDRELTDGRDDRTLAAAIRDQRSLSSDQIDKMVERYRSNWVGYRAETIARTEGLRVAHQGSREAFQQAIDGGHVEASQLERQWHHASGGKDPRPEHIEMNGQRRAMNEPFESGSGKELMYPGDPDADPSETLNCRCAVSTRLA
jgi:hypothetical protein